MATVLISGGTGLVGRHLSSLLISRGFKVIILTRSSQQSNNPSLQYANWNVNAGEMDDEAIRQANHIIHLAGAGVADQRWTARRKQEIVDSRTQSAALIVKALQQIPNNVQTVVSASAIGWYGPDTDESRKKGFHEESPADAHFLGETCRLWEESITPVTALGKRLVKLRIGIVLAPDGGALTEFMKPLKMGVAPIMGTGEQVISWIHIDDLCRMFLHAIETKTMSGAYNAVAPHPVTNKTFMLALAKEARGKMFIPVHIPAFLLKLMLGEMSVEILKSATVSNEKIVASGFTFIYPGITAALHLK